MAESHRTLVREVLASQLAFAGVVGLIAMACVWWVSSWVVRDNLDDWAARWVGEMESLGAGFFVDSADDRFLELASYLSRFPEIEYVRYYGAGGEVIYLESGAESPRLYPPLEQDVLEALAVAKGAERLRKDMSRSPLARISQAVIRESIVSTNLIEAHSLAELDSETTVLGYVELGLDYSAYDRDLLAGVMWGTAVMLLAFLGLAIGGWILVRRAVQPLADLQEPLEKIARGDLAVEVPASSHREIEAVGDALRTAIDKIRERDRHLTKLANFDPLTGLPSRYHFVELLGRALSAGPADRSCPGALIFLDLDQFKHINDTHGHQAGDRALGQIAQRLRQLVRRDDLIGRFGGDEFVLFVPGVSENDAEAIAQKLLADLAEFPLVLGEGSMSASCSLGVAMVQESSAFNTDELLKHADFACRLAKSQGRNRVCFYEPDEQHLEAIKNDVGWQRKLKDALRKDTLELRYQPILELASGRVGHYEVLVRLREDGRVYLPDQFLPAAIRFGLMGEVDRWVIDRALGELKRIRVDRPDIRFAINVAGSTFRDGTLAEFVRSRLDAHGVPPAAVMFEITEQVAIGSFAEAVPQIRELKAIGCEFAVDDFGTGYNSLSYLKRLPVQYIKIDGSFVRRLAVNRVDQTIVRSIADIARIMGKKTIAEFVGDEQTLELLRSMGVEYAQGYYVGKPCEVLLEEAPAANVVPLERRSG